MDLPLLTEKMLAHIPAARQLAKRLQLHERAIEAATTGITISDCRLPDMPLIFTNAAFSRMTGYAAAEVLGKNCRFLQRGKGDHAALAVLRTALRERRGCVVLLRNYRKDGTPFWNELTIDPVRDEGGAVTHYIGVQTDVTARIRAEEALHLANDELERRVAARTADLAAANAALLDAQYETLDRLARAAESRDDDTGQHTQRVGAVAALLARSLGGATEAVRRIERAAILHDVGKIGIPDGILLKPGPLTGDEFARMQTHTIAGAAILAGSDHDLLRLAEVIALSHHERWDGSGYPQRLAGEAIPLPGRIVAVADVFDALTHTRPYKPAWPPEQALAEVVRQSGRQFDPQVVAAFVALHGRGLLVPTQTLPPTRSAREGISGTLTALVAR